MGKIAGKGIVVSYMSLGNLALYISQISLICISMQAIICIFQNVLDIESLIVCTHFFTTFSFQKKKPVQDALIDLTG